MKALLLIGATVGAALSFIGAVVLLSRPDPNATYAGERMAMGCVGAVLGVPCLLIGLPLFYFCSRELMQ